MEQTATEAASVEDLSYRYLLSYVKLQWPKYDIAAHHQLIATHLEAVERGEIDRLMIFLPPRHGKQVADIVDILTPSGWRKHGDLRPGDYVFGLDGKPAIVTYRSQATICDVEIEFSNGEIIKTNKDHLWTVYDRAFPKWRTVETRTLMKRVWYGKQGKRGGRARWQLPDIKPIQFQTVILPIHPYVLGAWLGDGQSDRMKIAYHENDVATIEAIAACGYRKTGFHVQQETNVNYTTFNHGYTRQLRRLNLWKNKHIPEIYLRSNCKQREELLAGLIDTDGHVDKQGRVRFSTCSTALRDGVFDLATTLGFRPYIMKIQPRISTSGIIGKQIVYQVDFQPTRSLPTRIPRKQILKFAIRRKVSIKDIRLSKKPEIGHCIKIDREDGLYLVGKRLIPTHNTMLVSEYFPAWYLGRNPDSEIIAATYSFDRANDIGRKVRNQLISPIHQQVFPECHISPDSKGANKFSTEEDGMYYSVGVGGPITGRGANCVCGGTLVETDQGPVEISKLVKLFNCNKEIKVLSLDEGAGKKEFHKILATKTSSKDGIYEIRTTSGKTIKTTGDHRFFILGKGYIQAKDLQVGSKIISANQKVPNMRKTDIEKFEGILPRMLWKSQMEQSKIFLCLLQKRINKISIRNKKDNQKGAQRSLLFGRMFSITSCYQEPQKMRNMRQTDTKKKHEILFKKLPRSISIQEEKISFYSFVQILWNRIYSEFNPKNVLLKELSKCSAFFKDAWFWELSLQKWYQLCKMVQGNAFADYQTGWKLCSVPSSRKNSVNSVERQNNQQNKYGCPSYQRRSVKQSSRKFNSGLSEMSYHTPQIPCDTISMVRKVRCSKVPVYDIQVEKNSNFFANEILVHNCFLIDDPVKGREDADSDRSQEKLRDWFKSVAYTRMMTPNAIIVIMTRWTFYDLAGFLQEETAHENWVIIDLPAVAEEDGDAIGRSAGDALWPTRYGTATLDRIKKTIGTREWNALYQQQPIPDGGGIVDIDWFKKYPYHTWQYCMMPNMEFGKNKFAGEKYRRFLNYKVDSGEIMPVTGIVNSWDTAFKEKDINDPSACTTWGMAKDRYYLMNVINKRMNFPKLKRAVIAEYDRCLKLNAGAVTVLIEDKASGQSLIQELQRYTRIPIIAIKPDANKQVRLGEVSPTIEAGRVWIPEKASWLVPYETQMAQFPYGKFDDMVDSTSQFLRWTTRPRYIRRKAANLFWK